MDAGARRSAGKARPDRGGATSATAATARPDDGAASFAGRDASDGAS